jgi:phosphocarrier protein HPr
MTPDTAAKNLSETTATTPATARRMVKICNQRGLHARAAARFVQCVERFDAAITVSKDQAKVDGASIMGLMMLAAGPGSTVSISAEGAEAEAALAALAELIAGRFGEEE